MYVPSVEHGEREECSREWHVPDLCLLASLSSSHWYCGGFAGVHLDGPAEKRGSADQRERTALGSPVDKLPPTGQLGAPLVFSNISTTRGTSFTRRLFHNLVSISIVNW